MSRAIRCRRHLTLTMEHRGNGSSAVPCCDDEENVSLASSDLKGCIGWEISRIGDLDVDLLTPSD
jgi:hypothetical protein